MRARPQRLLATALGASLLLTAAEATAQEPSAPAVDGEDAAEIGRLPLAYAERPLTLPRLVLVPTAVLDVAHQDTSLTNLSVGAAFGVTNDLQVGAIVLPLQISHAVTYGQYGAHPGPALGATYRVDSGGTEVGLHLDATAITLPASSGVVLRPGLPFRSHAGEIVRIDFGFYLPVTAARTVATGFQVPFALAVNIVPPLHVGVSSGLTVPSVSAPNGAVIPFGAFAGYALGGKEGPILDIDPFFRWPELPLSSQGNGPAPAFEGGVELRWFLYL